MTERTMKHYPLYVEACSSDEGNAYMSKGHQDKDAFAAAARQCHGDDLAGWDGPRHEWMRVVPDTTGQYHHYYHPAKPGTRGAFPVTVMDNY